MLPSIIVGSIALLISNLASKKGHSNWKYGFLTIGYCTVGQVLAFLIAAAFQMSAAALLIVGTLLGGVAAYWQVRKLRPTHRGRNK